MKGSFSIVIDLISQQMKGSFSIVTDLISQQVKESSAIGTVSSILSKPADERVLFCSDGLVSVVSLQEISAAEVKLFITLGQLRFMCPWFPIKEFNERQIMTHSYHHSRSASFSIVHHHCFDSGHFLFVMAEWVVCLDVWYFKISTVFGVVFTATCTLSQFVKWNPWVVFYLNVKTVAVLWLAGGSGALLAWCCAPL